MKRHVFFVVWLVISALGAGCGDTKKMTMTGPMQVTGQQEGERKRRHAPPPQEATATAEVKSNPRFALLKPYFASYLKRPADTKVNIFRNNLAQFGPHVEIETDIEKPSDEPKTPLEYYDVNSYKLVLIMSGTAQSKALVTDPRGKSYVIMVGTKIGNHGGKVTSISATEVRIEEPGRPPVIKALEPPTQDLEKELQAVEEM